MDLKTIYSLRRNFTIIAITGRTGSGCTEIAETLSRGFIKDSNLYPLPTKFGFDHNTYRKYRIVYNYAAENFKPFKVIYYKDILLSFILKYPFEEFTSFLNSPELKTEFEKSDLSTTSSFQKEIELLEELKVEFQKLHEEAKVLIISNKKEKEELEKINYFFESSSFKSLCNKIHSIMMSQSIVRRNKTLQIIANNIRSSGNPYKSDEKNLSNIFRIAEIINFMIKASRNKNTDGSVPTRIVIDSLRNPHEIMFFRQRFSAFYTFAINRPDQYRDTELRKRIRSYSHDIDEETTWNDIIKLMKEEHAGAKTSEFQKQNVSSCIQSADIHISFQSIQESGWANYIRNTKKENISPIFSWGMQLLKFIALIDHPGIITPSPEERCMQIAYTAKYNSGCISRQVGAAITDSNYSLRAIGWNNTPEGHVPCALRNIEDLINNNNDINSFTPFEKSDEFREKIRKYYRDAIDEHKDELKCQNVSFCFKTIINSIKEGKNQVHTRSLHAEESAFLQISKYGGLGILDGKLFTTASPCELCSKKAYQLGIKVIYYIDPYPGISYSQILSAGRPEKNPKIRLFYGAIGNAYHWLYEPFMSYKDELTLILENEVIDITKRYKLENERLNKENKRLEEEITRLKK